MNTQELQQAIGTLQQEQADLQQAINTLEIDSKAAQDALERLFAVAERSSTPQATQAADEAETAAQELATQLRRKRAALVACGADLEAAKVALQVAERADSIGQLQEIHDKLVALAGELDANIGQPQKWVELVDLTARGNVLSAQAHGPRDPYHPLSDLFAHVGQVRALAFDAISKQIDLAFHRRGQQPPAIAPVTDGLNLERARTRIAFLRSQVGATN